MISEKMYKHTQGSGAIRAMFEEGQRLAKLYGRENVYDFSLGNPSIPAPEAVKAAIGELIADGDPVGLHGYMSNVGFPDVRRAVADSLNARFGASFTEGNVIMSVGATGAINAILKTLLDPGDEVIVISPYFVEYGNYIGNYDGKLVAVPADRSTFLPDAEAVGAAVTRRTKAILLNSPNNPTGVIYPAETLEALSGILRAKEAEYGTSIYIISDEPYRELAYDGTAVPFIAKFYKNTIVCYSWSKSMSLPGERIGYLLIPGEVDDFNLIFTAAGIATRILGYVNAPSLMQKVVARCIDVAPDIGAYDENRKLLYRGLTDCGYECVYPQGAFYIWLKTPCGDAEFAEKAKGHNILVVPGASFGCPGYVRIAYCAAKSTIENSLPGFKKLAGELGLS